MSRSTLQVKSIATGRHGFIASNTLGCRIATKMQIERCKYTNFRTYRGAQIADYVTYGAPAREIEFHSSRSVSLPRRKFWLRYAFAPADDDRSLSRLRCAIVCCV